jgi:DNA-binding response OmpR family regulator
VSKVLLLTGTHETAADILPSLSLLDHVVTVGPASSETLLIPPGRLSPARTASPPDAVLVDARHHLVKAKELLGQLAAADLNIPLLVVISEGAWAAITAEWGADDVLLHTAGPGEVEARIRLAVGRAAAPVTVTSAAEPAAEVRSGELVIDETTYSARIRGHTLDLTFKEFELLKFLAQHPKRVFTRSQLLQEVWGYDYFGGTRTVDVHVRRLRAKLGSDNEALIGTVRNVGYKFVPAKPEGRRPAHPAAGTAAQADSGEELQTGRKITPPGQAAQAGQSGRPAEPDSQASHRGQADAAGTQPEPGRQAGQDDQANAAGAQPEPSRQARQDDQANATGTQPEPGRQAGQDGRQGKAAGKPGRGPDGRADARRSRVGNVEPTGRAGETGLASATDASKDGS